MESLKTLRRRIRSVNSTMQLTKAMELVAAAKLRKAQSKLVSSRPYAYKMQRILENLSSASTVLTHPLFKKREVKSMGLVIMTSDRGLCGSYNVNIYRKAEEFLEQEPKDKIKLILIGKKGFYFYRKKSWEIISQYLDLGGKIELSRIKEITSDLLNLFLNREVDEIYLLYTRFLSTTSYQATLEKFLNIEKPEKTQDGFWEYIFEPSPEELFEDLLPRYCLTRIQMALFEALASEHGSRMIAMGAATRNAEEMFEHLTLLRNKARQASITKEMVEIASGVEAFK